MALLNLGLGLGSVVVLGSLSLDLVIRELGQFVRGTDIADLLVVALCEDQIDLFETAVRRLGVEEPDNRDEESVPGGKEQIGAPANCRDHRRREHDDGKVKQPVVTSRHGVGLGSGTHGRQLGRVQPWKRQPGSAEGSHIEEESEDGTLGGLLVTRDQTCKGDNHGCSLDHRAAEEELAATDPFDEEPREGSEDSIDNHVDTADQEGLVVVLVQVGLEQHGKVVDDGVAAAELLENLGRGANKHAAQVLARSASQEIAEASLLTQRARGTERVEGELFLNLGFVVVNFTAIESSEDIFAFFNAVFGDEVAGGVREEPHANDDDNTEDNLERNGEAPDQVGRAIVRSKVNPVGNRSTDGDDTTFDTDEETTVAGLGTFGLVSRDGGTEDEC